MSRIKRISHKRHRKVLALCKGFSGRSSRCYKSALQRLQKGFLYAYRDRKNKKRDFRSLWIQRINAALREINSSFKYSCFMHMLKVKKIYINRKMLAQMCFSENKVFSSFVKSVYEG